MITDSLISKSGESRILEAVSREPHGFMRTLLESKFYFVVLNHFCESWLKIDGLFYFVKSGNTKIISSETKKITSQTYLGVDLFSRQLTMLFYDFAKQ